MRPDLVMTAYTGIMFCKDFSEYHEFIEELLGTPIWTHEFASKEIQEEIRKAVETEYRKVFPIYGTAPLVLEKSKRLCEVVRRAHVTRIEKGCPVCEALVELETVIAQVEGK